MAIVWLESAPSRLVTTVDVLGELESPPSNTTTPLPVGGRAVVEDDHQVAGGDAVAGLQDELGFERNVVDEGAVLAAQIRTVQSFALGFECEVLARKAGVFGKAQFGGARSANGQTLAGERNGLHLTIGTLNQEFTRSSR
jgi:hypothetical protein